MFEQKPIALTQRFAFDVAITPSLTVWTLGSNAVFESVVIY